MRHCLTWILVLGAVLLAGCGQRDGSYEVKKGESTFLVDPEARTVSWDGNQVTYAAGSDQGVDWVELTYPDGSTFRRYWEDGERLQRTSEDYDPARYLPGERLLEALSREIPTGEMEPAAVAGVLGLFCLGLGGFYALCPERALFHRTGGASGAAEKSRTALGLTRAVGAAAAAVGAALSLWALTG